MAPNLRPSGSSIDPITLIAEHEVVTVLGASSSEPLSAVVWYSSNAAASDRALVPPEGSRLSWPATFSRASASSASFGDPRTVRDTRRRRPVTGSRDHGITGEFNIDPPHPVADLKDAAAPPLAASLYCLHYLGS